MRYVICGFVFDKKEAEELMAELGSKLIGATVIELEAGDRLLKWSDVAVALDPELGEK